MKTSAIVAGVLLASVLVIVGCSFAADPNGVTRVSVTLSGGYDTDPRDGGRPVVLVAAGLGVKSEVFRDAFSRVHPANTGFGPTREEAQQNKAVLMGALGKYGITNERLDEVSNFYRYVRSRGELWKHKAASASALVKDGKVIGFEVTEPGYGYSSTPVVSIPKMPGVSAKAELAYGTDLKKNGSLAAIKLVQ